MEATPLILSYGTPARTSRIPQQTWIGLVAFTLAPLVSVGLCFIGMQCLWPGHFGNSIGEAIRFAASMLCHMLLPFSAIIYSGSGLIRSMHRRITPGIVLSIAGITLGAMAWLFDEAITVCL